VKNHFEVKGNLTVIFINLKGKTIETLINTDDLEKVKEFPNTWFAYFNQCTNSYYVRGNYKWDNGKRKTVLLHRWIFDDPKGLVIDHINHDTLNNTKNNLRCVTSFENMRNRKGASKHSKSGIRGVTWDKQRKKWRSTIQLKNNYIDLGFFDDIKRAEQVVVSARKKYLNKNRSDLKMNISTDLIKQYADVSKKLMESGVIGGYLPDGNIHVRYSVLVDEEGVVVKPRKCEQYPYEISVMVDGIKIFGIMSEEEFQKYPQLQGYMIEDVQLDGGGDHAA
jgi:hypothetical protein